MNYFNVVALKSDTHCLLTSKILSIFARTPLIVHFMEENNHTTLPPEKINPVLIQDDSAATVEYTEDNIRHLDDMEHIRVRSGMYIGRLGDGAQNDDGI